MGHMLSISMEKKSMAFCGFLCDRENQICGNNRLEQK